MKQTNMKQTKWDKLRMLGYRVTSTQEFLGLSDDEMALIDLKISLIQKLKETRSRKKITQQQLARLIHSSQSRIAKMGAGDPHVSLDLIVKALVASGMTRAALAAALAA